MNTEISNQQWMQNEFKDYSVKFNNNGERCLVSITTKCGVIIETDATKNILSKLKSVRFLIKECHKTKNFDPAITIRRII